MNNPEGDLANYLTSEGFKWKSIPPRSPNFGGLWKSGVKSFKYHLRVTVSSKLTFEELLTVVTQIEGILNSRPISPMSAEPSDLTALTPGHFLIGRPLNFIAERTIIDKPDNYLTRWQRTTKFVQCIWKRWSLDYLKHLNLRNKWMFLKNNVKPNDMVFLRIKICPHTNENLVELKVLLKMQTTLLELCTSEQVME
ncbi:uncharacterized protein LOC118186027 [Stegodyphus dumicola]|uniref:uncharacterized protein LOC118186027 n=1 Tax=Stegodyphus dumicola TaxID=202533 RepID=UPI0015A83321|nr:uncharacterized protein LOC118186027 [Stegodyphus dumicola]